MNKREQLAFAITTAANAHSKQFDKGGKPYILHPLHLMNQLLFDPQLAAVAVLHDAIEDSDVTIDSLRSAGMSPRVLAALHLLTHNEGLSYESYIERICSNYDAIRVKRKDLEHNSDITRLKGVEQRDIKRIEKYHKAFVRLSLAKRTYERLNR